MKRIKHISLNGDRQKREKLELAFAKAWERQNKETHLLAYLLGGAEAQTRIYSGAQLELKFVSQRDAEVAATVVQWLGSEVGQHFLESVINKGT